jgi:SAM-dependent methyltransferase
VKPREDAFGMGFLEHLRGREAFCVIERDDGYIDVEHTLASYFNEPAKWSPAERSALREVRGRVLDVGAGAGRVALCLQSKGHRVTAIDISPLAVRVCRMRGVRDARVLPIKHVAELKGRYDTVVMYGNNFGLFGGVHAGRQRLRALARVTVPGARIVA